MARRTKSGYRIALRVTLALGILSAAVAAADLVRPFLKPKVRQMAQVGVVFWPIIYLGYRTDMTERDVPVPSRDADPS